MRSVCCYELASTRRSQNYCLQVASYVMLGIPKHEEAPPTPQHPLSPMGDACSRMDLTAIHQILVMTHYKDDEGTNEVIDLKFKMYCNLQLRTLQIFAGVFTYIVEFSFSYLSKSGPNR